MRIVIVTTNEPFYLPVTLQRLFNTSAKDSICLVVLLPPTAGSRTWRSIIGEQSRFGIIYFFTRSLTYVLYKVFSKIGLRFRGRYYGVDAVCEAYGIPCLSFNNINSSDAISTIYAEFPHIIISLSASQIFRKEVLDIPRYATINVHNAPLPKYQGLMPSFWVLYNGERDTATSVHLMDTGIDTGDIIIQHRVVIDPDETLDSLIRKTKMSTVDALLDTFELFEQYNGHPPTKENKKEEATYFGFPSKRDIHEFKRKGKKLLWKKIY